MGTKQSAASDPRNATLLTVVSRDRESGERHIMTKHYVRTENGEIKSKSYGNAYLFDVKMVRFDSLDAIADTLKNATPHQCIIRGGLIPGVPTESVKRRLRPHDGEPPTFEEAPRSWVMIDLDNVPLPEEIDPTDPEACGEYLSLLLPVDLAFAKFVLQFSSSHLVKPENQGILKCHLFFLLSRPLNSAELKAWLRDFTVSSKDSNNDLRLIDPKPFETVQPHYISDPLLEGIDDPLGDRRIYIRTSGLDYVEVPEVIELEQKSERTVSQGTWDAFAKAAADAYKQNAPKAEHHRFLSGISSVLHRSGYSVSQLEPLIEQIARLTAAEDPERRRDSACSDTIKRLNDPGVRVPGRKVLREEYGFDIDEAMRTHLKHDPIDLAVAELNARYALVTAGANQGRIVDLEDPACPVIVKNDAFANIFKNNLVPITITKKETTETKWVPKSEIWLKNPKRREIAGIVFEPDGSPFPVPEGAHNRWQGFDIEPKEGDSHKPFLKHLWVNVCQKNKEHHLWLVAWLADMVQQPGAKPGTAVALKGVEGCGKSVVAAYMRMIFGPHAMTESRQGRVTGQFNAQVASLVFLGLEESFFAGDPRERGVLKDLITGTQITVEQKYADPYVIHSHVHILVTSNAKWVVPTSMGDRRWGVFNVRGDRAHDLEYWRPIWNALKADGASHLLHYLLSFNYEKEELRRPPMTLAKVYQTMRSLEPLQQ